MLVAVNGIPLAVAVAAEVVSWLLLAVAMICFLPASFRRRVPFAVLGAAMLVHATTGLQHVPYRVVALMAACISLTAITTGVLVRGQWRTYLEAQSRFGRRSSEALRRAMPVTFSLLGIAAAYMVIVALVFKGAGF